MGELITYAGGHAGECVLSSTFSSIINAESWQTSSGTEKEGEEEQTGLHSGVQVDLDKFEFRVCGLGFFCKTK